MFGGILIVIIGIYILKRFKKVDKYKLDQLALSEYLEAPLDSVGIGKLYERYLGYLATTSGYIVNYNGAVNAYRDYGRDLILENEDEVVLVQAKCWSKFKTIHESHIFQLYGSLVHYRKTNDKSKNIKALFCTTAGYSEIAIDAAKILGIELKEEELFKGFPMVKCIILDDDSKTYVLPFEEGYDGISIDVDRGESFAKSVDEAVSKGFDPYCMKTPA